MRSFFISFLLAGVSLNAYGAAALCVASGEFSLVRTDSLSQDGPSEFLPQTTVNLEFSVFDKKLNGKSVKDITLKIISVTTPQDKVLSRMEENKLIAALPYENEHYFYHEGIYTSGYTLLEYPTPGNEFAFFGTTQKLEKRAKKYLLDTASSVVSAKDLKANAGFIYITRYNDPEHLNPIYRKTLFFGKLENPECLGLNADNASVTSD